MDILTFNPMQSLKLKYFRFLNLSIYIGFPWLRLRNITCKLPIIAKKSYWVGGTKKQKDSLALLLDNYWLPYLPEYATRHLFKILAKRRSGCVKEGA